MVYALAIGNWQRGGGKGSKPEPLKTPGDQAREHAKHARALDKARQKQAEQRAKKQAQG